MWTKIWQNKTILLIVVAVLCRLYAVTLPAQPYDIGTFEAWGQIMLREGPSRFFATTWSDYLPLPIYFTAAVSAGTTALGLSFTPVFKFIVSLLELILLSFLARHLPRALRGGLVPLLFLSPALIGDSAWWGQLDTLPALMCLLALLLVKRRYLPGLLFGLALSVKPIFLILAPLLLFLSIKSKTALSNTLSSLAVFLLPALPVFPSFDLFFFLRDKLFEQASTYPYRSINAFNFWQLGNPLNLWPPDNVSYLGISAHTFGLGLFIFFSLFTLRSWSQRRWDSRFAPRVASCLLIFFYVFTTRMHERHLLFGLPFLALAALQNKSLLVQYLLFTAYFFFNLWAAFFWVVHDQTWPLSYPTVQFVSWLVVLTSLSLLVWDWRAFLSRLRSWILAHKLIVSLLLLALFLRLSGLAHPPGYIFDEVYHAFTARELLHNHKEAWEWWNTPPEGVAYEWTHPPLAKYAHGLGMLVFGENAFGWRIGSALMGTVTVAGLYSLALALSFPRSVALSAAFLLSIEGLNLSQSRLAMNDIFMLGFVLWSLVAALRRRWKLASVLFGLALSSKWSAVYSLVPLAVVYLHQYPLIRSVKTIVLQVLTALRYLAIALLIYFAAYIPFLTSGHTPQEFLELHRQMWYYHTHLTATHAYQSQPWQWVLSLRPVWYWVEYGDLTANIYSQGNPLILWLGLVALLLSLPRLKQFAYRLLIIGYFALFLPWVNSPRIMFFYHYLPSASLLCLLLAAWLTDFSPRVRALILAACILVFVLLAPVYYGFPMPSPYWDTLFGLFPSWK